MRRDRLWIWWIAAGVAAIAGISVLSPDGVAGNLAYDAVGLATVLGIVAGVRLNRPARPAMWYWFAGAVLLSLLGDLTWGYYDLVLHVEPYPSAADIFYLASYPLFAIGLLLLLRQRRRDGSESLIDAAIVAVGLGLVFWIFVLRPIAADGSVPMLERSISTAYPAVDLLLLVLLARLLTDTTGRTASTRLLSAAMLLVFAADASFSVADLYATDLDTDRFVNALFLLSYLCWGAAALHPSAAGATAAPVRATRTRLGLFAACSMAAPVLLFVPGVGDDAADRRAVGIGASILFVLVIARLGGMMRQASRLAMSDDLTGLANRRRLEQAAAAAAHPQIALFGVDGFKNVNDELGRPAADRVLAELAGRLAAAVSAGAAVSGGAVLSGGADGPAGGSVPAGALAARALVARVGGDEFAVLLDDASAADLRVVAETALASLRRPVDDLLIGVTAGLAGGAGTDAMELLRQAEAAMHAAKRTGEQLRRWSPALDERSLEHARLGAELRAALDDGQFRVFYQPIVELPSERVHAVEALVRWEHPTRGFVSPADFIPVAEQNGLIVELGAWIMRTACLRLSSWRADLGSGAPDRVSVNVSAKQLARAGFSASVAAILTETGLPPRCLTVEVTETAVFEGGPAVTALHELRALGVGIALDDFGTGHSSLGLLQTVPVTTIKVDKSFVDNITEQGRQTVIAETLITLSQGLGLNAVAEGVETAEQAAELHRLGYRFLQGYHYGRPVPDPAFGAVAAAA